MKKKQNLKKKNKSKEKKEVTNEKGWCEAKLQAFNKIEKNPNAYYYRFNHPGEDQKNGKWSSEEKQMFMNKLKDFDTKSPNWGLFSKDITGRVGYQCSNFYRSLVKNGEIEDPNYIIENGKLKFKFGKNE